MLRQQLDEISEVFGPYVAEAEVPVVVERDPLEAAFLKALSANIAVLKDRVFGSGEANAVLRVTAIRKPLEDLDTDEFEFVVPFVVIFDGMAEPAQWATIEKDFEGRVKEIVSTVAGQSFSDRTLKLVRRKKSDPYKEDPRSLTLLRFRLS